MAIRIIEEKSKYHVFALEFPFDWAIVNKIRAIRDQVGWKELNFSDGKWRLSHPTVVEAIKKIFPDTIVNTSTAVKIVEKSLEEQERDLRAQRTAELRSATESDFHIKNLKKVAGKEPFPYQRVGVEFLVNNKGRGMIADEMGTGKTFQTVAYFAHDEVDKALVVCPATVKGSWEKEVLQWTRLKPYVVDTKHRLNLKVWNEHDVIILNYEQVKKYLEFLLSVRIGAVAFDECHKLKNPSAERTKACKMIAKVVPKIICLTGTPIMNRPGELFNALHMIDPKTWPNYWHYLNRYCNPQKTFWGTTYNGITNAEELRTRIAPYYIRREKKDVLKFLPERLFADVPTELDPESAKRYALLERGLIEDLHSGKFRQVDALEKLNAMRQICSLGKIDAAIEFVEGMAEQEKVIFFSVYNEPLRQMREYFKEKCVYLTGETPQDERTEIVKRFQEDDSVRIFLGGVRSAGEGITLTAAKHTVFCDFDWVPASMDQAASRNHRPGVTHQGLNVWQMYCKNTIDDKMRLILEEKRKIFNALFGKGDTDPQESMVKELLESYKNAT